VDAAIRENIQALAATFERGAAGEFVLHGNKGDWFTLSTNALAELAPRLDIMVRRRA
jgi:hypothetical protein